MNAFPKKKELKASTEVAETILKPAPSCSNMAMKTNATTNLQQQQIVASSSSSSGGSACVGVAVSGPATSGRTSRPSVSAIATASFDKEQQQPKQNQNTSEVKVTGNGGAHSTDGNTDEDAKAELAAKKSRLKQKLVKSARSVAIFSLKLKERRQREAEKAATIAIEHAKSLAKSPPPQYGGELSLIPIEQLIQIEDLQLTPSRPTSSTTLAATTSRNLQQQHHYQQQQ